MLARLDDLVHAVIVRELSDGVGLSGSTRLVAADIVTAEEDTVDGEDLSWFEQTDISDYNVSDIDDLFGTVSNALDRSVLTLLVELFELAFLLPIVHRSDHDNNENGDDNSDTFDPFDVRSLAQSVRVFGRTVTCDWRMVDTDGLVDTKGQRDDGDNGKQNLALAHEKQVNVPRRRP